MRQFISALAAPIAALAFARDYLIYAWAGRGTMRPLIMQEPIRVTWPQHDHFAHS